MIRSVRLTQLQVTIRDLQELLEAAEKIGASEDSPVEIHVAPTYNNPLDPGGEITLEVTAGDGR